MYTLFIQKKEKDQTPYPLTEYLHQFLVQTKANAVFVSPGHLSMKVPAIEELLKNMLDGTSIEKFAIGNKYISSSLPYYENYLKARNVYWAVDRNGRGDHRKMVFILKYHTAVPELTKHDLQKLGADLSDALDRFLSDIEVLGVAIGSSNFSLNSYGVMNPGGKAADKGEADILMFGCPPEENGEKFAAYVKGKIAQSMDSPYNPGRQPEAVLSQSISSVPNDFLKEMFKATLEMTLSF